MQDVQHPSLVGLRELVFEDGRWFIVMDLVEGVDFIAHVRTVRRVARDSSKPSGSGVRATGSAPTMRALARRVARHAALRRGTGSAPRCGSSPRRSRHATPRGFVHRDVKPSNVLVTRAGKVVVLDFGLVAETRSDASTQAVVGTPAYMAPEQAASGDVGPEADLYAVGVLLYEALTGRVPIDGAPLQVMLRKQSEQPLPPREAAPGVPADLDALCLSLLRFNPAERPGAAAVLRALGDVRRVTPAEDADPIAYADAAVRRPRDRARRARRRRHAESRKQAACVVVEGESGLGKSRLVRRFTERIAREDPRALVLFGRCYERESVPYKAFDGVVDALARFLAKLPDAEARALMPDAPGRPRAGLPGPAARPGHRGAGARRAARDRSARAAEPRVRGAARDARAPRRAAAARRRHRRRAVGGRRQPQAPGGGAARARRAAAAARRDRALVGRPESRPMSRRAPARSNGSRGSSARTRGRSTSTPLSPESSRELASLLLRRSGEHGECGRREHRGRRRRPPALHRHPRPAPRADRRGRARRRSSVEDALRALLSELDPDARAIVETVSLADAPLRMRVVAAAVGEGAAAGGDGFVQALQRLRVGRLVVSTGARGDALLEPYHDRVRAAVLADTPPERRRRRGTGASRSPSRAADDAEPRALALHWGGAGDPGPGVRDYASLAGDRAAQALAFDRAASFYEQAMQATELSEEERRKLKAKLGDALANGGRGKRAADVLREAAVGAPAAEALELRRRAADQLLRSGHFDEGVPALEAVLRSVGVRLPSTPLSAIVYLLVAARVALRARTRIPQARPDAGLRRGARARRHLLCGGARPRDERPGARRGAPGGQPAGRAPPRRAVPRRARHRARTGLLLAGGKQVVASHREGHRARGARGGSVRPRARSRAGQRDRRRRRVPGRPLRRRGSRASTAASRSSATTGATSRWRPRTARSSRSCASPSWDACASSASASAAASRRRSAAATCTGRSTCGSAGRTSRGSWTTTSTRPGVRSTTRWRRGRGGASTSCTTTSSWPARTWTSTRAAPREAHAFVRDRWRAMQRSLHPRAHPVRPRQRVGPARSRRRSRSPRWTVRTASSCSAPWHAMRGGCRARTSPHATAPRRRAARRRRTRAWRSGGSRAAAARGAGGLRRPGHGAQRGGPAVHPRRARGRRRGSRSARSGRRMVRVTVGEEAGKVRRDARAGVPLRERRASPFRDFAKRSRSPKASEARGEATRGCAAPHTNVTPAVVGRSPMRGRRNHGS